MPLNNSGVPASLRASYDVNQLSSLKDLCDSQLAANFVAINLGYAELTQYPEWAGTSRFAVTKQGFIGTLRFACAKTELKRRVSIPLDSFLLNHCTRASLNNGYWHERAIRAKNLAHP
jgi:hypothetical protein